MPNKYAEKKECNVPKQRYKLSNWSEYSDALRRRGDIDVWLSEEAISLWYEKDRVYDGAGAYDETPVYDAVVNHSPSVDVVIPLKSNAVLNDKSASQRNSNIIEIAARGRMGWQKKAVRAAEFIWT